MKLMRATAQAHICDVNAYQVTGQWQKGLIPDDLAESIRLLMATLVTHAVRLHDDQVRRLAEELRSESAQAGFSASKELGDAHLKRMGAVDQALNERVGLTLRNLDQLDE